MRDEMKPRVQVGTVVQLNQHCPGNVAGNFMIVTEPKAWGAEGYLQHMSPEPNKLPTRIPWKAQWKEMEFVGQASHYSKIAG